MQSFNAHPHWVHVQELYHILAGAGYRVYLAGGCVRDLILGLTPKDFDLVTDAPAAEIEKLLPKTLPVGKQFGIFIVPYPDFQIEVAIFRKDGLYTDGRHPEKIELGTPEEDALRRDFTINALFYDLKTKQIIDYVNGQEDLKNKVLRCVGEPEKRFSEDYLRILRALRFSARLSFKIEEKTWEGMKNLAFQVPSLSQERITEEFGKLLSGPGSKLGVQLLIELDIFKYLWPDLSETFTKVKRDLLSAREFVTEGNLLEAWYLFFAPIVRGLDKAQDYKKIRSSFFLNLKMSHHFSKKISQGLLLIKVDWFKERLGNLLLELLKPGGELIFLYWQWLISEKLLSAEEAQKIKSIQNRYDSLKDHCEPLLNGQDLITMGFAAGPKMGEILQEAYLLQLEGQLRTKSEATMWAQSLARG